MNELSPGGPGTNPEQPTNEPVREASTGFINRIREELRNASYGPHIPVAVGSAAVVVYRLFEGKVTEAVIAGVVGGALTVGLAVLVGRDERRLNEQSAELNEKFAGKAK